MKPISDTAFYCCGVRMDDAASAGPLCGDTYAKIFMSERGIGIYDAFREEAGPNASNVVRHRIIDDLLRDELRKNRNLQIILIGAGFDSRAYRLEGGRWIELDEPAVISYKNDRLPVSSCPNDLQRVPIEFSTESLEEKLLPFAAGAPTVFVIEGVFIYLEEGAKKNLLQTLRRLFPDHRLICDLMTRKFFDRYARRFNEKIVKMGTSFNVMDYPDRFLIGNGYRLLEKHSIVRRAIRLGAMRIPGPMFYLCLHTLRTGYGIYVFAPG